MNYFFPKSKYQLAFFCILLLHFISNSIWLILHNAPVTWDPASHTWITLKIAENIRVGALLDILYVSNYYPIFIHLLGSILIIPLRFFIYDPFSLVKIIQYFGTGLFIFTLVVIYRFIKNFYSEKIAFFSTSLFSFFPIVFSQSRYLMLDIISVGLFFLTIHALFRSRYLTNKKNTVLFFLSSALLIMTKWVGVIYLFVPVIGYGYLIIHYYLKEKIDYKLVITNIIQGSLLFAIIVFPWYFANFSSLEFLGSINVIGEKGADPVNLLSLENIMQYFYIFTYTQVSPIPAFLFIISILYSFFIKFKYKWSILTFIFINYLLFTFISNKDARYTMFVLPFVAIFMVHVFLEIRNVLGRVLLHSLFGFLICYFLLLTIRPSFLEGYKYRITIPFFGIAHLVDIRDYLSLRYDTYFWSMPEILKDLASIEASQPIKVLVASELMYLNASNLQTYKLAAGLDRVTIATPDVSFLVAKYGVTYFPDRLSLINYVSQNDYIIVPETYIGPEYLRNYSALVQIQSLVREGNLPSCSLFQQVIAPAGTTCLVNEGELFSTGSDVVLNDLGLTTENVKIAGPSKVYCEWGCSFSTIESYSSKKMTYHFEVIKKYPLEENQQLLLIKIIRN